MKSKAVSLVSIASMTFMTSCSPAKQQEFASTIGNIQTEAVRACSFLPAADSIARLIPAVSTVAGVVNLLCSALREAQDTGAIKSAGAVLPGSNLSFPVRTASGTIEVQGSLVQPGVSAPGLRSEGMSGNRSAATGIGNGGRPVERPIDGR